MDKDDRLQVSLRLKAGRWLAGRRDDKGRATALSVAELARYPQLAENNITKNRLEDIEQMDVDARPYELASITQALKLPVGWFGPPTPSETDGPPLDLDDAVRRLEEFVKELQAAAPSRSPEEPGSAEGNQA